MTEAEWIDMVKRHQRRVFSIALSVLRNVEDARETTQDVFMKLYVHMDTIRDHKAIPAWLATTSYHAAINRVRLSRVKRWIFGTDAIDNAVSPNASQEDILSASQELRKIAQWKRARLSPKENVVLQLRHGEEMTMQEISAFLRMSVSSVKTHYYRAQKKMEALLGPGEREER